MNKRLKVIKIIFENLDTIDIPAVYFKRFCISGIHTTVERLAPNAIFQRTKADQIELELLAQVDTAMLDMSRDLFFRPEENWSLLKRIENRRDLAILDLHYDDGSPERIYLPWEDTANRCHNRLLKTQRNNGNLIITISAIAKEHHQT